MKKIILLGISSLLMNIAVGMQPAQARWKGRAIIMTKDPQTQQWRVLLAHRPLNIDPNDVWADFDEESRGGERGNVVAARAVNAQTNNIFKVMPTMIQYGVEGDKPAPNASGDWFQFIPVGLAGNPPFKSGQELYKEAKTAQRDDFLWVNANDIMSGQPIYHTNPVTRAKKQITISRGVHTALRKLLPIAIQELNQRIAQPAAPALQPVVAAPQPAPAKQSARPVPVTMPKPAAAKQPAAAVPQVQAGAPWGPNKPNHIYFYQNGQPYYDFTNFFVSPITIDGKVWPTSEHYFQAQKYPTRADLQERIRKAGSPRQAFDITREPANDAFKARDWDTTKFNAMLKAVRAKFNQHQRLRDMLLGTGNPILPWKMRP